MAPPGTSPWLRNGDAGHGAQLLNFKWPKRCDMDQSTIVCFLCSIFSSCGIADVTTSIQSSIVGMFGVPKIYQQWGAAAPSETDFANVFFFLPLRVTPQKMDKWLSPNHALVGFYLVSSCSECYEHLSIFYLGCWSPSHAGWRHKAQKVMADCNLSSTK